MPHKRRGGNCKGGPDRHTTTDCTVPSRRILGRKRIDEYARKMLPDGCSEIFIRVSSVECGTVGNQATRSTELEMRSNEPSALVVAHAPRSTCLSALGFTFCFSGCVFANPQSHRITNTLKNLRALVRPHNIPVHPIFQRTQRLASSAQLENNAIPLSVTGSAHERTTNRRRHAGRGPPRGDAMHGNAQSTAPPASD